MRIIEFAPQMDWDAVAATPTQTVTNEKNKATKNKKKKPKKQSKQRLKGGR